MIGAKSSAKTTKTTSTTSSLKTASEKTATNSAVQRNTKSLATTPQQPKVAKKTESKPSTPSKPQQEKQEEINDTTTISEQTTIEEDFIEESDAGLSDGFYSIKDMENDLKKERTQTTITKKPTKITPKLVADKCLTEIPTDEDELYTSLFELKKLNLDRCNIRVIENLDLYGHLTHIYLQCNCITELSDEFRYLPHLVFLALFDNKIKRVENELADNLKLQYLDLSNNDIEHCELENLPKSLVIFNIDQNPLILEEEIVKEKLPNLVQYNMREYLNEEFVTEEKLPFDRSTLTKMRSSQSGMELLNKSTNSDDSNDSSVHEDQIEKELETQKLTRQEYSQANNEIVETYKKALMEEMERIKTEFSLKKDKLLGEIKERSQREYEQWRQRNSQQQSSEEASNEPSINHQQDNIHSELDIASSYPPTQIQNDETQQTTNTSITITTDEEMRDSQAPSQTTNNPSLSEVMSSSPILHHTTPTMLEQPQPVPVVTPEQASLLSLASSMNYEKAPIREIPNTKYTMVLFPGKVKNVSNAIQMLGGMKSIQKLHKQSTPSTQPSTVTNGKNSKEPETSNSDSKFLECRFRPGNFMSCHPVYGDATSTNNLLVRIRRKKIKKLVGDKLVTRYDSSNSEISVIGTLSKTVNFKGMSDFQYIQPKYVDLDQSMDDDQNSPEHAADNNFSNIGDEGDEMHTDDVNPSKASEKNQIVNNLQRGVYYSDELSEATSTVLLSRASLEHPHTGKNTKHHKAMLDLPPPIFSRFDLPMDYAFKQNPLSEVVPIVSHDGSSNYKRLIKKNKQYIPHCVEINFEDEVPMGPPPDIVNAKDKEMYTDMEKKLRKLFGYSDNENEEPSTDISESKSRKIRPMWSRSAITSKFESRKDRWKLRMVLPRIAYHYKSGPWRMLWVRYGYDPKKDVSAAYYQMLDFRIPQELRPTINALAGKKKDDEMETNKFRRLPKRRTDLHIDLHDYLYSGQNKDNNNENDNPLPSATTAASNYTNSSQQEHEDNAPYEFNSVPTQIQVFYQLCDIRISSAQNIIMAEKDEKIPITYGVLLGIKSGEELGLREYVWNQNAECDSKSGWYTHHALEQVRHIMKKKIEEWLKIGEENDHEILSETEDEAEPERQEESITQTENVRTNSMASLTDDEMRDDGEDLFIGASNTATNTTQQVEQSEQ